MKRTREKDDKRNGWYEISPADAANLLNSEPMKNRTLSELNARKICEAIKGNRWTDTGESIILDSNGRLADGQHRLRACVLADKPISSFVVFMPDRLGATFFDGIDQGKMRNSADRLGMDGVRYAAAAASVCRMVIAYEQGTPSMASNGRHNPSWIRRVYESRSFAIDSAIEYCSGFQKELTGLIPLSVLSFCHMMASEVNQSKALAWTAAMATGENISRTSPIYLVRRILNEEARRGSHTKRTRKSLLGLLAKSWLHYLNGETPKFISFRSDEKVPKFRGKIEAEPINVVRMAAKKHTRG